ncbi:sensor histidine kinase [Pseudodesulfovibrio piezophilus]|uniref:histidine kinase n=1 Tax=Pseudodesulfovibrio piezophilus (strain DSM 21447 / JCM 15486 / C1TLV30) TaxID=1322246 RepID=M1WLI5_PSEP2|nr:ATP-binding protein [Pseudodesulfovibrio piezophilus]CCH47925.1 Sensor protein [Pseudodesulfovibrio piezophilus C1TLV30]
MIENRQAVSPFSPLRTKLLLLLTGLVVATLAGASLTLWYVRATQEMFQEMATHDIQALFSAQSLQKELMSQQGLTTYYSLDHDETWLQRLNGHHKQFEIFLKQARLSNYLEKGREILNNIDSGYLRYVYSRNDVINLYRKGRTQQALQEHKNIREKYQTLYDLCEEYKALYQHRITLAAVSYKAKAQLLTVLSFTAMPVSALLAIWLGFILVKRILDPIRKLARLEEALPDHLSGEMGALSDRIQTLMDDVEHAYEMLQHSRDQVVQSEKMATVGKLAAGVAHSIRNPLTSVKMRLFSLERSLDLDAIQKEDFDVISEEIRHLDTIIRNFIEFSRPPKLRPQQVSPSDLVESTLTLLVHRLEASNVIVTICRKKRLPDVSADPEQFKEALMNLILNACDSMVNGGRISITEDIATIVPHGKMAILTVTDNGPGIPPAFKDEIFKPFHSTKEEGTGLGLSIANRIMTEHGGWLHLKSSGSDGTTFVLAIPLKESSEWLRS